MKTIGFTWHPNEGPESRYTLDLADDENNLVAQTDILTQIEAGLSMRNPGFALDRTVQDNGVSVRQWLRNQRLFDSAKLSHALQDESCARALHRWTAEPKTMWAYRIPFAGLTRNDPGEILDWTI